MTVRSGTNLAYLEKRMQNAKKKIESKIYYRKWLLWKALRECVMFCVRISPSQGRNFTFMVRADVFYLCMLVLIRGVKCDARADENRTI